MNTRENVYYDTTNEEALLDSSGQGLELIKYYMI